MSQRQESTKLGGNLLRRDQSRDKSKARRDPEPIESILKRWMRRNQVPARMNRESVFSRWSEISRRWCDVVGEDIGAHTRVVDVNAGVLVVEVDSSALLHELATYYRQDLLESLHQIEEFTRMAE